jgi:hypothetical protein
MSKLQLSDDQIERAMQAFRDSGGMDLECSLRAAADHLQAKLEEPTEEDVEKAFTDICNNTLGTHPPDYPIQKALEGFVRRRNAAMTKPVDPRIEILQRLERHERSVSDTITDLNALEDSHAQ